VGAAAGRGVSVSAASRPASCVGRRVAGPAGSACVHQGSGARRHCKGGYGAVTSGCGHRLKQLMLAVPLWSDSFLYVNEHASQ
jgi:hypothetical protein